METWKRSQNISRIVSGQTRLRINNEIFIIRTPTLLHQCLSDELFTQQLEDAEEAGAYSETELKEFLQARCLWTYEDEETLKVVYDDIDKLKIALFETRLRSLDLAKIRKMLEKAKVEVNRLELLKHSYDHVSAMGMAHAMKQRYLLGCSVYDIHGEPYWPSEAGWEMPDGVLDRLMFKLNQSRLTETEFRELARTDPWKGIWNLQKHCSKGIFDCSVMDLTEEQKSLIVWSSIYESVSGHSDNLEESVINDDDMLDGWMSIKRKEREKDHTKSSEDSITSNEKIKNSQEMFVKVNTAEDAKRVINMNDEIGTHNFKQRMETIKQKGEVKEQDMPDTAARLRQERVNSYFETVRNK